MAYATGAGAKAQRGGGVRDRATRRAARRTALAVLVLILAAPQPASADSRRKEGKNRAFGSCVRGVSPYGAYVELNARMNVNWKSASQALVDFAFNESVVADCGPSGNPVRGGQLKFHTRLEFIGDQLEKCSAGFPGGVSCEMNPDHTQAVYEFSHGPVDNNDGRGAFKVGGAEVNTGKTGHVYSVKFITSTTLSEGANAATAQTTVDLHY
jgi:hypothetical protein